MTEPFKPLDGGCLCGAVRFRVTAEPTDAGYCHCRMCQKNSGAPVVAWAALPHAAFAYTKGTPGAYKSSPGAQREFCRDCGSYMIFRDSTPTISVNIASLDEPARVKPAFHIWCESRIPWFDTADALKRYARGDWDEKMPGA